MNTSKKFSTRAMVITAVFSAVSFVLMLVDFALPFTLPFIKMDVSDIPSLILAFALGPVYGVLCELLKNLLHLPMSSSVGAGELSNFVLGCALVIPAGFIYKLNKTRRGALIAMLTGTACYVLLAIVSNLFVMFPLYSKLFGLPMEQIVAIGKGMIPFADTELKVILLCVTPSNIIKGIIISAVTFLLYKPLSPIIKGAGSQV